MGTSLDMAVQPEEHLEMTALLHRVRLLSELLAPVVRTCVVIDKIRRWESSMVCVLLLVFCNGSCFLFPPGYTLVLALTLLAVAAVVGFAHRKARVLAKVLPSNRLQQDEAESDMGMPTNHSELLEQYKAMLFQINTMVTKCNEILTFFYAVIRWENLQISIRCYIFLGFLITGLHVLPLRWSIVVAINLFLLENQLSSFLVNSSLLKAFIKKISQPFRKGAEPGTEKGETTSISAMSLSSASSETDISAGKDSLGLSTSEPLCPPDSDTDVSQKLEDSSSCGEDSENEDQHSSESQEVKARSGVVGRILEFKKKHQNASSGSCTGCGANFSAILKRRHVCNHCGNHFCARCCSHKVPKSLLGATAPGAYTETVPVCTYCHGYLTGKKDKSS